MKFPRPRLLAALTPAVFIAAALIVIGLPGGGPSSAATSPRLAAGHSSATAEHSAAGQSIAAPPVIIDCLHQGLVRPGSWLAAAGESPAPSHRPTAYRARLAAAPDRL